LALQQLKIFIPYSTNTKDFAILEIAMPHPILLVIHLPFRVDISSINFLFSFPRMFLPISFFVNQMCSIILMHLNLGVRKNGRGKGASSNAD
jgi:hypothetical protein